jgi:hypothetical protein
MIQMMSCHTWKESTDFDDPDDVMPYLGTLFGLTEDATPMIDSGRAIYLSECSKKGTTTTVTRPQGWDDLAS